MLLLRLVKLSKELAETRHQSMPFEPKLCKEANAHSIAKLLVHREVLANYLLVNSFYSEQEESKILRTIIDYLSLNKFAACSRRVSTI